MNRANHEPRGAADGAVALAPLGNWISTLDSLKGKRVRVRGEIVTYCGRVEIVLKDAGQISAEPTGP